MANIDYTVLHIFGYGETQVIGKDLNKKVDSSSLTKLQAVVDNIYSKKPADNNATADYHAINIFNSQFVDYMGKFEFTENSNNQDKTFRIDFKDVDSTLIDELISEINAIN
jgi:hypothetical protein